MDFTIRILQQKWIEDGGRHDLCSHGEIDLRIGGRQVSVDGQVGDGWSYGVGEAALGLLRTLKYRHTGVDRVAYRLIPHGCGLILMMGCDIGIHWYVRHDEGMVCISDVVRYDSNDITQCVEFPDIRIQIPWKVYAEQIVGFAAEAKAFFNQGIEKDKSVETIEGEYDAFWSEYDHLLESWEVPCERDLIRDGSDIDFHP
ncbi:MAG: hypothetical protein IIB57_15450 [Planctomycetes bacterium]|nr:hypothetical protein [Planctomycetota bacterium]